MSTITCVGSALKLCRTPIAFLHCLIITLTLYVADYAHAQVPDLTNGEVRTDELFWNLGPTGMRGWMYHEGAHSTLSRQIEVTTVDAAGPSNGILAVGDVILGADGTGANPVAFTSDARIAFAHAIADAEANNPAELKILRWRAGVTDTVTVTLEYLGAYSATAPYNCPKSAAILEKGLDAIVATGSMDSNNFGLITLLAGYDAANPNNAVRMALAQQEAYELILTPDQIAEYTSGISLQGTKVAWHHGLKMMALGEYYLHTGDTAVYDSLRAYAIAYANGQSMFGTAGHNFALPGPNGEINGPYAKGYGVVNSANMQCYYGALLAREAGVTDQVVLDAIDRASTFYGSYAHRGSIPYGEHGPGGGHESNGKSGAAAACFALEGTRDSEANFNIKMTGASADTRDRGHTGPWFNYFWAPIGANLGGEASMATFFAEQSWHYDLSRNWDGTFTFDTFGQGSSDNGQNNWGGANLMQYMTALITYAMPLKQTYITGKNLNPALELTAAELSEVQLATHYDASGRTTNQLIQDLDTWSPPQRSKASVELGLRTSEHATILPILHTMATDTNGSTYSRMGACFALGEILDDSSVPVLAGLLTDPSNLVRWAAANGLDDFSQEARLEVIDTLLSACITTARPLLPLDPEDPIHLTHARVASAVFGGSPRGALWGHDLVGIDRDLLYEAMRAVANHPQGAVRGYLTNIYPNLNREDVEAIADAVLEGTYHESPADRMFSAGIRNGGLDLLQSHNFAEGVKMAMDLTVELDKTDSLDVLINYAADSLLVEPDHKVLDWLDIIEAADSDKGFTEASNWPDPGTHNHIQWVRDAINNDPGPYEKPEPFKRIYLVYADNATLTLPDYWTGLHVDAHDYARGDTVYTWRKIHGAGEVSFYPNGTGSAKDTTVFFDGPSGEYLFEVKMSDSFGYTEVTETVAVTLEKAGGGLDPNTAPTANNQAVSVEQGIPTQVILTGNDPEGYDLVYTVTSGPSNGVLSGTAPHLVYTASPTFTGTDTIDFEVMDSEGQVASGTITITVGTVTPVGLAIYEPFAGYPVDGSTTINGLSGTGEIGLDGTWTSGSNMRADDTAPIGQPAGGYTYGPLPTTGSKLWTQGGAGDPAWRPINVNALANSGLLADGATLWMSALIGADDTWLRNVKIALANASFDANKSNIEMDGADLGTGLGFELNADKNFYAAQYIDATEGDPTALGAPILGTFDEYAAGKFVRFGDLRLVVAKITWGATSDTVEVYLPLVPPSGEGIVLPDQPSSTLVANVDQSKFDVLTISRGHQSWVDEIRVGASLDSVLLGTVAGPADDGIAPEPNPMTFAVAPMVAGADSITMTAAPAYDPLGVEYFFACTAGGGNDSGWQESNIYTDTGLTAGVAYSYTVKTRDKTPGLNESAASAAESATIPTLGTVPNLVGIEQSVAETMITDAGMTVGTINNAASYSLTVPAGHVLSQTPTGPTSAAYATAVDLEISIGQDPALPTITSVDIVDNHGGLPVTLPAQFIYTLTFSQDMDLSTFDAGDFVNLSSFPITIGAISEPSPGVITVEVVPATVDSGLLLFAIAEGAVITDATGNALNTTSAIVDDETLEIIRPSNYLPVVDAGPDQNLTELSSQPWTPSSMTVTAWYDAADIGSINQSGGAVSQWNDKSGNGLHATQTTASKRPITGTRTLNGKNVLDFTTVSSQSFSIPSADIIGKEVWAVMLVDDFATAGSQLVMGGTNNSQVGIQSSTRQLRLWQGANPWSGDTKSTATVTQGEATLLGWMAHTDTKKYSINGVLEDTGNTYLSGAMVPNKLGGGQYADMDGVIAEVIVTTGALSAAERERLEGYLAHKWGLAGNLPVGHTYKSAAPTEPSWATTLDGTVSDDDNDPLVTTWTQLSGPAASAISDASAVDTSAVFPAAGSYVLQLTADDGIVQISDQVTITVSSGPDTTPPTLAGSDIVDDQGGADVLENDLVTYTVTFSEDMDDATVDASDFSNAGTSSVTIGSVTETSPGVFTVEATPTNAGSLQLQVSAGATLTDVAGNPLDTSSAIVDDTTITVTVPSSNNPPIFTADPFAASNATEDAAYSDSIAGSATDPDVGDTLTYSKSSGPSWLNVASDGTLSGTPSNGDVGANGFTVLVSDGNGGSDIATLNITVLNTNDAPAFASDPIAGGAATVDQAYTGSLAGSANDDDGDTLTFTKVSGPAWLSVATNGDLTGTPVIGDLGLNSFTVSVSDSIAPAVQATLEITVSELGDEEIVSLAEVFAHNENDNFTGITTDLINGSGMNGHPDTGVAGWPTGEGLPSTWTATLDAYRAEHQSRNFLQAATPSEDLDPTGAPLPDGVGPTNGKIGWYIIDIGEVTTDLRDLYIWHIRETSTRIATDFNIYISAAPTVAVAHGPTGTSSARDYDFASGGWTLVSSGQAGVFRDVTVHALNGASARYIGLEIMANGGDTNERVGFAEVGITRSSVSTNTAPVWAADPVNEIDAIEDAAYASTLADDASDAESDPLTFAKVGGPAWLSVASDGALSGTPTNTDVGVNVFTVSVADGVNPAVEATLNITVLNTNDAPVFAADPINGSDATEDSAYAGSLAGTASDDDGDSLTYAKVSGPAWLNVAANGDLSGTPDNTDVGANVFTVSVSDGIAAPVEATLNITVLNTNDAPVFAADPINGSNATEDVAYGGSLAGTATDDDGDSLTYAKVAGPAWLIVAADGTLSGAPGNSDVGSNVFTVSVSDSIAAPVQATLNITVINTNDVPVWTSNPVNEVDATEDAAYASSLADDATDIDAGASLTFAKVSGPAWLIVASNGALSGTPSNDDVGVNVFTVSVSDSIAAPVNATLNITVINTNDAPVFSVDPIAGSDADQDVAYTGSIAGSATDDDGDALTYTKVSGPAWLGVAANGDLSGTPTSGDVGANAFTVSASDGIAAPVEATLNILVIGANNPPVVDAGANQTVSISGEGGSWTPADIATAAWWDAADLSTITESGGAVSQWDDKSGNGNHATQSTTSKRPVSGARTIGGNNIIGFDNANSQSMVMPSIDVIGKEVWAVYMIDDYTTTASQLLLGGGGNVQIGVNSSSQNLRLWKASNPYSADNRSSATVPVSTPTLSGWLAHTSTKKLSVNGVLEDIGDTYVSGDLSPNNIGRGQYAVMDGAIAEIIVTSGELSVDDREKIEGYLAHKWGLAANLPAGHTYKSAAPGGASAVANLDGTTSDDDLDPLTTTWSFVSGPASVSFGDTSAEDTTATFTMVGTYVLELTADDGQDQTSDQVTITVDDGSDTTPPTLAGSDIVDGQGGTNVTENELVTYTVTFSEDMDDATVDASDFSNAGTSSVTIGTIIETSPGVFTVEVTPTNSGTLQLQVSAAAVLTDVAGNALDTASAIVDDTTITVDAANVAPVWASSPVNEVDASEDAAYSATLADDASDANSDTLTFAKVSGPAWLNVAANGDLTGTPANGDVGANAFTVSVTDSIAAPVEVTLNITVINTNDAPVFAADPINGSDATEDVGYAGSIAGSASDDDGDGLSYAKVSGPAWLSVAANGDLTGIPTNTDVGANVFTVSVDDGNGGSDTATLNIAVINTNDAPAWTSNPVSEADATEDAAYASSLADNAVDIDSGASLAFAKVSGPAWLSVAANGDLSGTPTNEDVGANAFTVSVSDGIAAPVQAKLNITVINTNDAPVFTADPIAGADATLDSAYAGTIAGSATDDDGDSLTYAKVSGPAWLSVASNGALSGTPTSGDEGANVFTVSASDGTAAPVNATLNITVNVPLTTVPDVVGLSEAAATSSITAASLVVGTVTQSYSATVPEGDVISQGLTAGANVPEGSSVDLVVSLGPAPSANLVRTTVSGVSNASWTTVNLGQTYNSLVVVATPIYGPGVNTPVVTRITNVTSTSFDLKLDRADGLSGTVSFDVSVVAVEEGVYTQAQDGFTMEAVKFTSTSTAYGASNWVAEARTLQNSYTNLVVVGQVMSYNDTNWSTFFSMGASRQDPADASSFNVSKHVGQDPNTTRANETIGYIVIEAGNGTIDGVAYEAGLGADTVQCFGDSASPYTYTLSGTLSTASAAAVSQSGMDGNDGSWAVLSGSNPITPTSLGLHVAEDWLKDSREKHTTEQVGYLVFE